MACTGTQTYSKEYAKIKEFVAKIPPAKKPEAKTLPKDTGTPAPSDKTKTPAPANNSDKRQKKLEKPGGGL